MGTPKSGKRILLIGLLLLIPASIVLGENTVTIVGELIDDFQFVTDNGLVFEIGDTEKGAELLSNLSDQRIRITGTIKKTDDTMVIYVTHYEIMKNAEAIMK